MCLSEVWISDVSGIAPTVDAIFDCFSHFRVEETVEKWHRKSLFKDKEEKKISFYWIRTIFIALLAGRFQFSLDSTSDFIWLISK